MNNVKDALKIAGVIITTMIAVIDMVNKKKWIWADTVNSSAARESDDSQCTTTMNMKGYWEYY